MTIHEQIVHAFNAYLSEAKSFEEIKNEGLSFVASLPPPKKTLLQLLQLLLLLLQQQGG